MPAKLVLAPGVKLQAVAAALTEFIDDVEAVGVTHLEESWPDLVLTYRKALKALYRNPKAGQ